MLEDGKPMTATLKWRGIMRTVEKCGTFDGVPVYWLPASGLARPVLLMKKPGEHGRAVSIFNGADLLLRIDVINGVVWTDNNVGFAAKSWVEGLYAKGAIWLKDRGRPDRARRCQDTAERLRSMPPLAKRPKRKHRGREGPDPTVSERYLAPFPFEEAVEMAAAVVTGIWQRSAREANEGDAQPARRGRPPANAADVLLAGLTSGMARISTRHVVPRLKDVLSSDISFKTVNARLTDEAYTVALADILLTTRDLVRSVGANLSPVGLDGANGDVLGCLVKQVGIGRARRKNDRGLLADALLRGISANLMMFREHADERPRDEPSAPIEHTDGQGEPENPVGDEVPNDPDGDVPPQFMLL